MHQNRKSTINVAGNSGLGGFYGYQENLVLPKVDTMVQSKLLPPQMQRTVFGVLSENDQRQRTLSLGAAPAKPVSGVENMAPLGGKLFFANAALAPPKPCFTIYADEPEENQENCSLELQSFEAAEADIKQKLHLILDAASPMITDTSLQCEPEVASESDPEAAVVAEYITEIHQCLREAELKHRPKPYYMRKQPDITSSMRTILVDWLAEVQEEYKLRSETLFLAINYLDRFLSCMSVLRGKLQLVGTAAILLASKYEEICPPEIEEFVYITDDTYTKKQLLRMEHLLLKPETLQDFTGYSLSDLAPCLVDLHRTSLNAPHQAQQAIRERYKSPMYMQASLMPLPATLPL
ncbi:hypothetical protein GDO78_000453 [Eleutherodactylus coqui]|uniref:Cyclin-like domain-containing protein n=1 Tax=Eleutherodactylus coqui TaxID=57060 RepID=A0A8J6FSE6_ELECQ|nr:hypothetical protein GDO78_000453 [Eleutherodactylus coqui]